jgi:PleD family two-component response regulator
VSKPFRAEELLIRVDTQIRLKRAMADLQERNEALEAALARNIS